MANIERMARNAAMLGNTSMAMHSQRNASDLGRTNPYFLDDTVAYANAYGALASDVFEATCQGLSETDWYEDTPVKIRSSASSASSMGETMPDDWHRVYIIAPRGITHIPQGAYMKYGGNTWIVFKPKNIGNVYAHGIVRRCNAVINKLDYYGNIISVPMSFAKVSTLGNSNQVTEDSILAKNYVSCICQLNETSKQFTENTRFVMGKSAYSIRGLNDFTREFTDDPDSVHLLTFTVERNEPLPQDSIDKQCADYGSFSWELVLTAADTMKQGARQTISVQSVRNGAEVSSTEEYPISYTFSNSNPSVATVSYDGQVRALKEGTTTVTVKLNQNSEITAKLTIQVAESGENYVGFTTEPPKVLKGYDTAVVSASYFENGEETDKEVTLTISGAPASATRDRLSANTWILKSYGASYEPLHITAEYEGYTAQADVILTT